jgi:hypothetical protein
MPDDSYENKARLGRIVLNAAKVAVHDDSDPDLARLNAILTCEVFVSALVDVGCMITRIPSPRPKPADYPPNVKCVCGDLIHPDQPFVELQPDGSLFHWNEEGGGHRFDVDPGE